jgi:hypothetical protein
MGNVLILEEVEKARENIQKAHENIEKVLEEVSYLCGEVQEKRLEEQYHVVCSHHHINIPMLN